MPAVAKAGYFGEITSQGGYTFETVATSSVTTSVTVVAVVRDRLEIDRVITVTGDLTTFNLAIPKLAEQMILLADTRGGSSPNRVGDDRAPPQEQQAYWEVRVVFDVIG
jgi:hypothetical protein